MENIEFAFTDEPGQLRLIDLSSNGKESDFFNLHIISHMNYAKVEVYGNLLSNPNLLNTIEENGIEIVKTTRNRFILSWQGFRSKSSYLPHNQLIH
jgi:hypothetical protein